MNLRRLFLNNLGIKILALFLAFITWVYIGEVTKKGSEKTVLQKLLSPRTFVIKKMTIRLTLTGSLPEGYAIAREGIKVMPDSLVVAAPRGALLGKEFVYTKPIDLSEYTRSKALDVELKDLSRAIKFEKTTVQVIIPIEKNSDKK